MLNVTGGNQTAPQFNTTTGVIGASNTVQGTQPASIVPQKDFFPVETGQKKKVRLSEDQENEILVKLKLNPNQAKAVTEFSSFVLRETVETLLSKFDGVDRLKEIQVRDLKKPQGGVCDVAKANCSRDHVLRYLWTIEVKLDNGSSETMHLGSDCFTRATGLTKLEIELCKSLNTWVINSANRSLMRLLARTVEEGKTALELFEDFKKTKTYQELQSDMQFLAPRTDYAHPKTAKPTARRRAIGRTLVALKSATLLLLNDLPVPGELVGRISRAAHWAKVNCSPTLF